MTARKQEERKVFHLFHGCLPGVVKTRPLREDDRKGTPSESDLVLPLPCDDTSTEILIKGVDPRDERTLIVWDGALLPNGLPRGSTVLLRSQLSREDHPWGDRYKVPWGQAYKKRETDPIEDMLLPRWLGNGITGGQFGVQEVFRFFVLMGFARTATVLRFNDKSLAPRYVFVEVEKGGKSVRWRQSSY